MNVTVCVSSNDIFINNHDRRDGHFTVPENIELWCAVFFLSENKYSLRKGVIDMMCEFGECSLFWNCVICIQTLLVK